MVRVCARLLLPSHMSMGAVIGYLVLIINDNELNKMLNFNFFWVIFLVACRYNVSNVENTILCVFASVGGVWFGLVSALFGQTGDQMVRFWPSFLKPKPKPTQTVCIGLVQFKPSLNPVWRYFFSRNLK